MALIVRRVGRGPVWDKVQFEATEREESEFGSILGEKRFCLKAGEQVTVRRSKTEMWEPGDRARSLGSIITAANQHRLNWCWS